MCHNPYFNRWFSAMEKEIFLQKLVKSHNPYFNRWFSAIKLQTEVIKRFYVVTILILIDGFLQWRMMDVYNVDYAVTILILIDGFLQ